MGLGGSGEDEVQEDEEEEDGGHAGVFFGDGEMACSWGGIAW